MHHVRCLVLERVESRDDGSFVAVVSNTSDVVHTGRIEWKFIIADRVRIVDDISTGRIAPESTVEIDLTARYKRRGVGGELLTAVEDCEVVNP